MDDEPENPHLPVPDDGDDVTEPDWVKTLFGEEVLADNTILNTSEEYVSLIQSYDCDDTLQEWIVSDMYSTFGVAERDFELTDGDKGNDDDE